MKRELERALKAAGSVKGLARALRKTPGTIRRWIRKGVPKRGDARERLLEYKEDRKAFRAQATSERKELKRLMALSREQGREIPKERTGEGSRVGPRTFGYRWTKSFRRFLSLDLIDEFERWAAGKKRRFPIWQMAVSTTLFSPNENFPEFRKSGDERLTKQLTGEKLSRGFIQEFEIGTPKSQSKSEIVSEVRGRLEDIVETPGLEAFVNWAVIYNYRMKTDEERRAFETRARYERKKNEKRSKARKQPGPPKRSPRK